VALLSLLGDFKGGTVKDKAKARADILRLNIMQNHICFEAGKAETPAFYCPNNLIPQVFCQARNPGTCNVIHVDIIPHLE
jgi:hypothetical protein